MDQKRSSNVDKDDQLRLQPDDLSPASSFSFPSIHTQDPGTIVREFLPSIRRLATALASRSPYALDVEDLTSAGTIGLLGALARYDPSREIKFRTFAEYRIRGMMLDEIRAMDWIPRSIRSLHDQIYRAHREFIRREGRPPERREVADLLGITLQELEMACAKGAQLISLDEPVRTGDESYTLKETVADTNDLDPFMACLSHETKHILENAISSLSARQQEVVQLYYFSELTMKDIGTRLGLTESGICRIHSEALRQLRKRLQAIDDLTSQSPPPDTQ